MSGPKLREIPNLWSANALVRASDHTTSTGFPALDHAIGGWPTTALIEFLIDEHGIGELQLLMPLIRRLQNNEETNSARVALWLNPPYEVHATALLQYRLEPGLHWIAETLTVVDVMWTAEQALRSGACALVLAWLSDVDLKSLRRLKLAALTGTSCVIVRRLAEAATPSPATLRMLLTPHPAGLAINVIKLQGKRPRELVIDVRQRVGNPSEETGL